MESLKLLTIFFLLSVSISFAQAPPNDECANRETITIGTSDYIQYSVSMTGATESLNASCENSADTNNDVWYEFVMPLDGILFISNLNSLNYVSIYDSCGGTEIDCGSDETSFSGLTSGTTYILRLSYRFNGNVNFRVQAFEAAANDECADRETISVSTSNYTQYTIDSRLATESMDASCDTATNDNLDLWYEFVMPVNGNIEIKEAQQFQYQTYTLFDSCGGSELGCVYDRGFFLNLTAGDTYILRISDREDRAGPINFRIQAFEFLTNNECADSQNITVETANSIDYTINFRAAYESFNSSCETESNENFDLWYDFIMPVNGNLSLKQLGAEVVTLYDACSGNEISCKTGAQFIYGLASGVSYKLRFSSTVLVSRNVRIQAFEEALNDDCINSEIITVETATPSSYTIDTRRATESIDASCENAANDNLDLWYEFVMPVNGNIQLTGLVTNKDYSVLFNSCTGEELDCISGNGTFFNLNSNSTYKLRFGQSTSNAITRNMSIQAFEVLTNDECSNAQSMTVETSQINTYSVNLAAATESIDASCNSATFNNLDVWYSFTMPVNGNLQITNVESSQSFSIFDACGGNELQCFTNDGSFTGLLATTDYILRVSEPETQSGVINFSVQAFEVVLNDECVSAEIITVDTTQTNTVTINLASATESLDVSCETSSNNNLDVWYQFSMPVNGNVQILNSDNAQRFTLFDVCSGNEIDCFSGNGLFLDLAVNTNYVLRVAENDSTAGLISFDIQALEKAINDECFDAVMLSIESAEPTSYSVNIASATESIDASCDTASNTNLDVWYTIEPTIDGSLVISGAENGDGFSLFNTCEEPGTDGTLNIELGCFNGNGSFDNLIANTTYILRIRKNVLFPTPVNFDIKVVPNLNVLDNELEHLNVFPNPAKDSIVIKNPTAAVLEHVEIYDLSGRKVKSINLTLTNEDIIIDISELQSSMYVLLISNENGTITKRILKQ